MFGEFLLLPFFGIFRYSLEGLDRWALSRSSLCFKVVDARNNYLIHFAPWLANALGCASKDSLHRCGL